MSARTRIEIAIVDELTLADGELTFARIMLALHRRGFWFAEYRTISALDRLVQRGVVVREYRAQRTFYRLAPAFTLETVDAFGGSVKIRRLTEDELADHRRTLAFDDEAGFAFTRPLRDEPAGLDLFAGGRSGGAGGSVAWDPPAVESTPVESNGCGGAGGSSHDSGGSDSGGSDCGGGDSGGGGSE